MISALFIFPRKHPLIGPLMTQGASKRSWRGGPGRSACARASSAPTNGVVEFRATRRPEIEASAELVSAGVLVVAKCLLFLGCRPSEDRLKAVSNFGHSRNVKTFDWCLTIKLKRESNHFL